MNLLSSLLKQMGLLSFVFLFIYMPVAIAPFNILHILAPISVFFLLFQYKSLFITIIKIRSIRQFIWINLLGLGYVFILFLFLDADIINLYYNVILLFEVVPIVLFIVSFLIKQKYDLLGLYNLLIVVGIVQSLIVVVIYILPEYKSLFMYTNTNELYDDVIYKLGEFRFFGFGRNYAFSMPLFQGICVILSVVLSVYVSKKYILLLPLFAFSIIINARYAIVSLFVILTILILYSRKRHLIKALLISIIIIISSNYLINFVANEAFLSKSYDSYTWLNAGFNEILNYSRNESSTINALINDMWFFPPVEKILVGTGIVPFRRIGAQNSDIGYVQVIYFGGLLYFLLLFSSTILLVMRVTFTNSDKSYNKLILLSIIIFFFLSNFKGNVYNVNEYLNGFLLIFFFNIVYFNKDTFSQLKLRRNY